MGELEMPDADEMGGNVTKPFKFVTGMYIRPANSYIQQASMN